MNRNEPVGSMPATNWIISASLKNSTERNRCISRLDERILQSFHIHIEVKRFIGFGSGSYRNDF